MFNNDANFCKSYLSQLKKFFELIKSDNQIRALNSDIGNQAATKYSLVSNALSRSLQNIEVNISPGWEFELNNNKFCGPVGVTKLVFGGYLVITNGVLARQSFVISITFEPAQDVCEQLSEKHSCHPIQKGEREVVRRFHFDLDFTLQEPDRPISHLQYGGKFQEKYLTDPKNMKYRLFHTIDHPRLPIPPYDPVLLLDMFISQFSTRLGGGLRDRKWGNLVKESEKLFLKDYFTHAANHLNGNNQLRLLETFYPPR